MTKASVLMLISRYRGYGGHEIVINNLCKGLTKLGHEVCIGAFSFEQSPPSPIQKIKINRSAGLDSLRDGSFDIYHSHQTQMSYYSVFTKKPFIFHCHGASNTIQELNLRLCMTICKNRISRTICVSKTCLEQLWSITKCDAEVIYNGVDVVSLNPNLARPYTKGVPQLLFVGKLYPHKKVGILVLTMLSIVREYPKAHLQIVGSGEDYQTIASLIHNNNLESNVEMCGSCSEDELKHRISSCDIYISASGWEMFGLPVLEAFACGKPVLLSDIPAHRELIESSDAGLIFSSDSPEEVTKKIGEICQNSAELGKKARAFAERCDWSIACENLSSIYDRLLHAS